MQGETKKPLLSLDRVRSEIGRPWLVGLFGGAFVVSQLTLMAILQPLGASFLALQCCGTTAQRTLEVYRGWERSGAIMAYRAHFQLDSLHWIWYAGLFTTLLSWLFVTRKVPSRFNAVLLLPLVSAWFDVLENRLQQIFVESPHYALVVDPLPLISTLASLAKWILAATYVATSVLLLLRRPAAIDEPSELAQPGSELTRTE
jgi:hypothetical protein